MDLVSYPARAEELGKYEIVLFDPYIVKVK